MPKVTRDNNQIGRVGRLQFNFTIPCVHWGQHKMPICPICNKNVSVFQWDLPGRGCGSCVKIDHAAMDGVLDTPCPACNSDSVYATEASSVILSHYSTYHVSAKNVAPSGMFLVGCSDCGTAFFRFNRKTAKRLPEIWIGKDTLDAKRSMG